MKASEKHSWLTWKNVHLVAVGCMVVGIALIVGGFALGGFAGNPFLAAGDGQFGISLSTDSFFAPSDAPNAPEPPAFS